MKLIDRLNERIDVLEAALSAMVHNNARMNGEHIAELRAERARAEKAEVVPCTGWFCGRLTMNQCNQIGADRLAYAVAQLIQRGVLDSRSEAGDALLDYLEVGTPGEPQDVPTWMYRYEASQNARGIKR